MGVRYRTPEALEMAVTAAARTSDMDTGRAAADFYLHRLLCRVFSRPDSPFLLKGGQSMLARTPNARVTRDIDLLAEADDLEVALTELKGLASIDLDDFMTFEFARAEPIKAEDEYRSGLKVTFVPTLGGRKRQRVSVDLVIDQIPCAEPDVITPANRIEVEGVPTFDYRVYPVVNSLADKACAMLETHGGRPSSRVKDLVDVLVYETTTDIDGNELTRWLRLEAGARKLVLPMCLTVPDVWYTHYASSYRKMVGQTGLRPEYAKLDNGVEMASRLLDSALDGSAIGMRWDHRGLSWLEIS